MHTIRQTNGLAGFTKRSESEYDCFGTGHSSTTISAGLGINLALFHSFCICKVKKLKRDEITNTEPLSKLKLFLVKDSVSGNYVHRILSKILSPGFSFLVHVNFVIEKFNTFSIIEGKWISTFVCFRKWVCYRCHICMLTFNFCCI